MRSVLSLLVVLLLSSSAIAQLPDRQGLPPRARLLPPRWTVPMLEIHESVEIDAQGYAKVVLESMEGCAPCERWKRTVMPGLVAAGWKVETVIVTEGSVPRWRVCIGDRCWRVVAGDWLDNTRLAGIVQQWKLQAEMRKAARLQSSASWTVELTYGGPWIVHDENGAEVAGGMSEQDARAAAKRIAVRRGLTEVQITRVTADWEK